MTDTEAVRSYPYRDGDVTVLGPEIFASKGGAVISWRGENYVRQQDIEPGREELAAGAMHELASSVRDLASAIRLETADRTNPTPAPADSPLRQRIAEALRDFPVACWTPDNIAGRAMRVRDRYVEQLEAGRATWKAKAEEIERDRDRLAKQIDQLIARLGEYADRGISNGGRAEQAEAVLREILARFEPAFPSPDEPMRHQATVSIEDYQRWRNTLQPPADALAPTEHVGNRANAEDCPACSASTSPPPYPWICPGPAPAHNAGPSVAECVAQDAAHWNDKYAGEGQ
jgi:hypothetical protein